MIVAVFVQVTTEESPTVNVPEGEAVKFSEPWIWTGLAIVALGIVVSRLIKRSAPHFVLTQALEDERIYEEVTQMNLLRVVPVD